MAQKQTIKQKYWGKIDDENLTQFIETGLQDSRLWLKIEPKLDSLLDGLLRRYFIFNPSETDYIITDIKSDLYVRLHKFDSYRGTLFNFVTTVCLNLMRNRFKKEKIRNEKFVDEDISDVIPEMF